ncbi:hypothetical protein ACLGIH_20360 [Streptomyces sp. HMX87]|uniref:hypothetical protein n=1 Tax=Streptomyces sp. HMX87 TaxID=3390849 RepID=UPI003A874053
MPTPKIARRKYGKPLFSGLDTEDKSSSQLYRENFAREQATESARAHLQTLPTAPQFRELPANNPAARSKYDPPKADARLTMTRGAKGVRNTIGTTSVPTGLRKSAGEKLHPKAKDGRRKTRAAAATRSKGAEKIVYNSRVGMTAAKRMTPELRANVAREVAAQHAKTLRTREATRVENAHAAREAARKNLHDAIARERDALARGDTDAAKAARADIKKFRNAAKFKGN